ncbi:hypothetical protein [Bacillus sp. FJAT-47783]|uniref:hypothetical protein n=1 Tax=Bacillus sp. FJAT-47783 TaxID=2922712 RepID=UPI001FAB993B|nr:hypothetical protein [Bacillus sp. FJAT-47783]
MKKSKITFSLLIFTLAISLTLPEVANVKAMELAENESIQTAKDIESITGTEEIIQSKNSNSTYNTIVDNELSTVKVPNKLEKPIVITDTENPSESLGISLPSEHTDAKAIKTDNGTIVYDNSDSSLALAVQPTSEGVKSLIKIKNATAPKEYKFEIDVPEGSKLITAADYLGEEFDTKEVFIVNSENIITSLFSPAWAKDADGSDIPTYYKVEGKTLIQVVEFNEDNVFPIVADPDWVKIGKCSAAISWFIGSNLFAAAKIIKVKKYVKELGGIRETAKLLAGAATWEEKLKIGGSAFTGLAAEISGVAALSVCK